MVNVGHHPPHICSASTCIAFLAFWASVLCLFVNLFLFGAAQAPPLYAVLLFKRHRESQRRQRFCDDKFHSKCAQGSMHKYMCIQADVYSIMDMFRHESRRVAYSAKRPTQIDIPCLACTYVVLHELSINVRARVCSYHGRLTCVVCVCVV